MRHPIRHLAAGALALGLVALPACGDDDDEADTGDTTTTSAADESTTTTGAPDTEPEGTTTTGAPGTTIVDGIDPMTDADTEPKSGESEVDASSGIPLLVDVRTGRHEGFDRITFEFDGPLPGYLVQYVDPPIIQDGSGDTVEVDGNAYLSMRFEPASAYDMEAGEPTFELDEVAGDGTAELVVVVRTGDFEAVLNWVAGLQEEVDFRVQTLTDPSRVVVDVRNH
jgi:hypothetical protein